MFKDLSIKTKLYLSFSAILAIILVLLSIAYNRFNSLSQANEWDRHTMDVMQAIDVLRNDLLQVQVEARGYYLTGAPQRLERARKELTDLPASITELQKLTADNPAQAARFRKLEEMIKVWSNEVIDSQLKLRESMGNQPGAADAMGRTPQLSGAATSVIGEVYKFMNDAAEEEKRLLAVRSASSEHQQETMRMVLTGGGLACVALSMGIAWLLVRSLLAPLNNLTQAVGRIAAGDQTARAEVLSADELGQVSTEFNRMAQAIQDSQANELAASSLLRSKVDSLLGVVSKAAAGDLTGKIEVQGEDAIGKLAKGLDRMFENLRALLNNVQKAGIQVTTSATEIAASAKQQEATGIEQAQTSVEILSTTREISANTSQLLKTMEEATAVADYTTSATADAQTNLKRMDGTMQNMVSATDSINAKLAALSEKASNINSVLTTITKVADQTNILSLNAAIEAEKAGEAGRGFSVVATEIRRLADQTSVSTWDIEQMLKEMQSAVSASVMGMDKFSEEIRRSVGEVRAVTDQLSGVMDQVQQLAPRFDVVLQGMQSQAVGAEQITATMMQLNDATQQTVESLKATSEAVRQLQYAAGDLQTSVANFAVTV
ncbi:methyl-accepting chemotaxis protein WspA [Duganella sp. SG902]|uniref:methyl-accepting chemotaxis protein n=1 Tax=Duganella sp. SG902 TaxID=2587016 RepID=UPI00159E8CB8|nr:methyl-accepting chemotaxis protein [Duganella sp. SG902]NVM80098.1 methyl-accepting chemotaxis protein WspA [Duganella sp. SG902]